jgi:alpha-tubulin suppressor-like RCC1 family protein
MGDWAKRPTPQPVPLAPALSGYPVSVCTGWHFSCVLDSNKDVACTGKDDFGQQGTGDNGGYSIRLAIPTGVSSVVHLACGYNSVLATTKTGSLMAWGGNTYGGLGVASVTAVWEAQVSCLL